MITALAGGVGAAKLLSGLVRIVPQEEVTVIVNTGDDIELYGLHISPDVDIVTYTLAGIVDEEKGWGIKGDTFNCLEMLRRYGYEVWFNLGDRDIATHLHRTVLMQKGMKLSQVTSEISRVMGLKTKIIPMTDDKFETWIETDAGFMHFEEYFVKRGARDRVLNISFRGVEEATPATAVLEAIMNSELIVICPSNPLVSIGPILLIKGIKDALKNTMAPKIAVSPIVGGTTIKGPADKMMKGLGLESSAYAVADMYKDFLDIFVIDTVDITEKKRIEEMGIEVVTTNTVMKNLDDKIRLAQFVLEKGITQSY